MLLLLPVLFVSIVAAEPSTPPTPVTMAQLVVTPERLDGKLVRIVGFVSLESEDVALYDNENSYRHVLFRNAIWLELDDARIEQNRRLHRRYVLVEGVFNQSARGHLNSFAGAITDITRFELWSDPEKPRRKSPRWLPW
jgi:hypothetical protein